jgi:hypothetical protein
MESGGAGDDEEDKLEEHGEETASGRMVAADNETLFEINDGNSSAGNGDAASSLAYHSHHL